MASRSSIIRIEQLRIAYLIVTVVIAVFVARLWQLQIVRGESYRQRSEHNRLRPIPLQAPRGVIADRHGTVLARNRPSFNIEVIPDDVADLNALLQSVSELTGISQLDLSARMQDTSKRRRFEPRILIRDASRDVVATIAANRYRLPGVLIQVIPAREYVYGTTAAHVLGYIREITRDQLAQERFVEYRSGELVGQFGIEAAAESKLRGKHGAKLMVVNAVGSRVNEIPAEKPSAGEYLQISLDLRTQQAADASLRGRKGAIVALDAHTGDILAMSSSPAFDPAQFARSLTPSEWKALVGGESRPLNNRAIQGAYPPGSVFKMFTALAALERGVVSPRETVYCPGFYTFGGRPFRCHKREGHGNVDLRQALVLSCDVYFYVMGQRAGVDAIHDVATRFGLGRLASIGIGDERAGLIPSTRWKARAFKDPANKKWHPGETLSVAIGQGAVTVTPLQLARAIAGLVNGGKVVFPRVLGEAQLPETIDVKPSHLALMRDGMVGVVNDERGTGRRARLVDPMIVVGGKTGTAQVVALDKRSGAHHEDHAWFAGFAPANDPRIVVVALVENGGGGGLNAAPLVRTVMEAYFRLPPWSPR